MIQFINRFATPLTTGLFAVSTVSGVALFFHWLPATFHGMHEWLSMVLLLPFAFHVWKNWRPLLNYARNGTLALPLIASLIIAVPFAVSGLSGAGGGNPAFRVASVMTQATLSDLAPVLKTSPDALVARLKVKGFPASSTDQTLQAIAAAAGKPATEALLSVIPAR